MLESLRAARATDKLNDKLNVVLVGASGGIGQGMMQQLLASGAVGYLACCTRTKPVNMPAEMPAEVAKDVRFDSIALDFTDEESIKTAASKVEAACTTVDLVLVTTGLLHDDSGMMPEKSLRQLNAAHFVRNMQINALGPALIAKHFLPLMNKKAISVFGALSARVGSIGDNRLGGWHSYRASKAALNMLIKNMAIEYQRKCPQLIIVGLHPGTVATPLSAPFQKNVPAGKLFTPDYAAERLLTVIDQLKPENSGYCFAWDGQRIIE